jgi:beta-glucanase (GH16 family)
MFQKNRFLLVLLFAVQSLFAQIPQGFNYQATVRNQTGELLTNEYVGIRFHIVQGTEQNNPVYSEFHYESTDDLGSLHLMIGQGTVEAGAFNQIDWSLGDYHMGIEINTGSGFIDMGTTQLMSVPFALYALNSGTTNSASLPQGNAVGDVLSWNGSTWTAATSNGSTNLPEINTQEASDIKGSSARVEGEFWLDGSSSITAKGVVWSEDPTPTVALPTKTDEGPGATNFESQLIGLSPNTTYHYRGYATNAAGTFYGDEQTFTTGEGVVALTTSLVVSSVFSAQSGGNISDDGGAAITARGVCWSTLANPTIADSKTEDGTGTGSFNSVLGGLTPDTTYYLRSYATNAAGTFYGNEQTFTTGLLNGDLDVLVWADEFDYEGLPSSENWNFEIGQGAWGWGNGEKQYYTRENANVSNGILSITAKKEDYRGAQYTSTRLNTLNKFDFTYGRVEVRAKLPAAKGTWPAMWLLGSDHLSNTWPRCGEIDIMEQKGWDKNNVLGTTHWYEYGPAPSYVGHAEYSKNMRLTTSTSEFHVYTLEWTSSSIKISVDDQQYYTINPKDNMPFDNEFFIILNVAVGGTLGGTSIETDLESSMEIDYVRVYQ